MLNDVPSIPEFACFSGEEVKLFLDIRQLINKVAALILNDRRFEPESIAFEKRSKIRPEDCFIVRFTDLHGEYEWVEVPVFWLSNPTMHLERYWQGLIEKARAQERLHQERAVKARAYHAEIMTRKQTPAYQEFLKQQAYFNGEDL